MVPFNGYKFSNMGIQGDESFFINMVLFYSNKFSNMDISKIFN